MSPNPTYPKDGQMDTFSQYVRKCTHCKSYSDKTENAVHSDSDRNQAPELKHIEEMQPVWLNKNIDNCTSEPKRRSSEPTDIPDHP